MNKRYRIKPVNLHTISTNGDSVDVARAIFTSMLSDLYYKASALAGEEISPDGNYLMSKEPSISDYYQALCNLSDEDIKQIISEDLADYDTAVSTLKKKHTEESNQVQRNRDEEYTQSYKTRYHELVLKANDIRNTKYQEENTRKELEYQKLLNMEPKPFKYREIIEDFANDVGIPMDLVDDAYSRGYPCGNYGYQGNIEFSMYTFTNDTEKIDRLRKKFPNKIRIDGIFIVNMDLDF